MKHRIHSKHFFCSPFGHLHSFQKNFLELSNSVCPRDASKTKQHVGKRWKLSTEQRGEMPQEDSLPFISLVAHKRLLQGRTQHWRPVVKLYRCNINPAGNETLQPQQWPPHGLHSPLCKHQSVKQNKEVIRGVRTTPITHMYNYSYIFPNKISINPASERSFTSGQPLAIFKKYAVYALQLEPLLEKKLDFKLALVNVFL